MGGAGKRGVVIGWTKQSAARNARFMQSIDFDDLPERGLCFTLTVRNTPPTADDFKRRVKRLGRWLAGQDGYRCHHWVMEWTRAGRPHLHGFAFTAGNVHDLAFGLQELWLDATWDLGTNERAQHVVPIKDRLRSRWLMYVCKHAARGAAHYQRERENVPRGWRTTGRMWGYGGSWPRDELRSDLYDDEWPVYRRLIRSHAVADARAELQRLIRARAKPGAIRSARRRLVRCKGMLKCNDKKKSWVQGIGGFVAGYLAEELLRYTAVRCGYLAADPCNRSYRQWACKIELRYPRLGSHGSMDDGVK